jgi:hypothetical protein
MHLSSLTMQLTKSSNSQNETDNKQSVCGHEIIFVLVAIPFQVVGAEGQLSPILSQSAHPQTTQRL